MQLPSIRPLIVIPPVACAIFAAMWLTAAAAYENVRFAKTAEQLLSLIAVTQDDAAKDPDFGRRPGEDLLVDLARQGVQAAGFGSETPGKPVNAWHQPIRMTAVSSTTMRLETDVSAPACRRLALFFGKDAQDLKLQTMEAREENSHWRTFFSNAAGQALGYLAVNAGCGQTEYVTLALTLPLR